jgi:SAM-dependent methyltransferase
MAKIECFKEHYNQYEEWFDKNSYVYQSELKAVKHFIPSKGTGMEVGIGSGKFAEPLGIKKGIEPSPQMRRLAEERGLDVIEGIAEALPFKDASYDYVLMVTTICFVDDIEKSFQEVKRVLKLGGKFIIGFVDRESPLGRVYVKHKDENVFYKDAIFYSSEDVLSLLKAGGFINMEIIQTVFGEMKKINEIQDFQEGHGEGGFVVISAEKN